MTSNKTQLIFEGINSLIYYRHKGDDGAPVIIKVLKSADPTPRQVVQFNNEYEFTRNMHAPGVRKALGKGTFEGQPSLELEYVDGQTVKQVLEENILSPVQFLEIAIRISQALWYIHRQHIIHRDINSNNILINLHSGLVKIIDFGLASRLSTKIHHLGNPDALEGTIAYISPEQTGRMNRVVDFRTDLYSLGVTLYEMATGRLPFEAEDAIGLVHCHLAKTPVPPHEIRQLPAPISAVIMKLLAKNAEDRYQSA